MKKKTKGILIGLVALGVIGMCIPKEEETKEETKSVASEVEVETVSEESEDTKSTQETEEKVKQIFVDTFVAKAQKIAGEHFDYAKIEYDKESKMINMNVASDGLANSVTLVKLGFSDGTEWEKCKDNLDLTSKTMKTELEKLTVTDVSVSVNLLNDMNLENVLYASVDGYGVYDASKE